MGVSQGLCKFPYQDVVKFASYEEYDSLFAPKVLESMVWLGSIMSCGLFWACETIFSINLPLFSHAAVNTRVILLISLDTLSMKFCSSYVIMLNCCRVDWSWGHTFWLWCKLFAFWLTNGILLYIGCLQLSLTFLSWPCKNVNLAIVCKCINFRWFSWWYWYHVSQLIIT